MGKLKVLVVDDSVVYRRVLTEAVEATGIALVEHSASNGKLALERLQHGMYDVILLDINMPEMDGMETLKRIKSNWPDLPVIMISGTGGGNINITFECLKNGAMDFILKPLEENLNRNMEILQNNLMLLFNQIKMKRYNTDVASNLENIHIHVEEKLNNVKADTNFKTLGKHLTGVDIILVAASTGGPVALERLFKNFKENLNVPLLVVQHMPPDFTRVLAESLDKKTNICFKEASEGDIIKAGQGIIAPGGFHMLFSKDGFIKKVLLSKSEYVNGVRPAADILFKSVAEQYQGARVLAIVLTGMGSDGLEGIRALKEKCSCYCITQSEESCVVYGMPRCVLEAGLSDEVLDIDSMAVRIQNIVSHGS